VEDALSGAELAQSGGHQEPPAPRRLRGCAVGQPRALPHRHSPALHVLQPLLGQPAAASHLLPREVRRGAAHSAEAHGVHGDDPLCSPQ